MKNNLIFLGLLFVVLVFSTRSFSQGSITYSEAFTNNVYTAANCTSWNNFRSQLTGTYSSLNILSSLGGTHTLNDPTTAQNIANAMLNGTSGTWIFGGNTYRVSIGCGAGSAVELHINQSACQCDNAVSIRPCIENWNWGGVNASTCDAASQVLAVTFNEGSAGVAQIMGGASYGTLQDAINAASDGNTIMLLQNVSESNIMINKSIILDAGAFTLTATGLTIPSGEYLRWLNNTLTIPTGSALSNLGTLWNNGAIIHPDPYTNQGIYKGTGTFNGSFTNNGSMLPGN